MGREQHPSSACRDKRMTKSTDKELTITEADRYALSKMPDGWFEWHDVPYSVRCPEYRLSRLVDRGLVEREFEGAYPDIKWLYRVKESQP